MTTKKKTAVVIPAYNEEKTIYEIVLRTKQAVPHATIIVVNDGSKDRTAQEAHKTGVVVIDKKQNSGKGSVARAGCDLAYNKNFQEIVLMDADGQHNPEDIPRLLSHLEKSDIVFTYRTGGKQPLTFKIGNWGLNMMSWLFFGIHIKDTQSGFRALKREAYKQVRWNSPRYAMESEMIARAKNLRYRQVPIRKVYDEHHKGQDKGTNVKTGLKIGWKMFVWALFGVKKRK